MSKKKTTDDRTSAPQAEGETPVADEKAAPAPVDAPEDDGAQDALDEAGLLRLQLEEAQGQAKQAQQLSDEYLGLAQRVQADFENFRRRNSQVRAEAFEDGARAFIKTILPVIDNLERALDAPSADAALHEGVSMVYRQLCEALEKRGVTVIDRLGERFDPALESAVMQGGPEEGEPGTVCAVLQKGYRLGDAVLRFAMVKVVAEV